MLRHAPGPDTEMPVEHGFLLFMPASSDFPFRISTSYLASRLRLTDMAERRILFANANQSVGGFSCSQQRRCRLRRGGRARAQAGFPSGPIPLDRKRLA